MADTPTVVDLGSKVINLNVTQGNTLTFLAALKDSLGVRQQLTNYQWFMQVRHPRSANLAADLSLGSGIEFEPGSNDELVRFTIPDVTTETWECTSYKYDIEFVTPAPGNYRRTASKGRINVTEQQTQA